MKRSPEKEAQPGSAQPGTSEGGSVQDTGRPKPQHRATCEDQARGLRAGTAQPGGTGSPQEEASGFQSLHLALTQAHLPLQRGRKAPKASMAPAHYAAGRSMVTHSEDSVSS